MAKTETVTDTVAPEVIKAQDFILTHSKVNEAGDARSMNQSAYFTYMQDEHAAGPELIKAVVAGERVLVDGMSRLATSDLVTNMEKAKKEGNDPTECTATIRVSRPNGPLSAKVLAERTTTNPRTGDKITHHGVVVIKAKTSYGGREAAEYAEKTISNLMGIKK